MLYKNKYHANFDLTQHVCLDLKCSFLNMSFDIGTLKLTLIRGGFYHE